MHLPIVLLSVCLEGIQKGFAFSCFTSPTLSHWPKWIRTSWPCPSPLPGGEFLIILRSHRPCSVISREALLVHRSLKCSHPGMLNALPEGARCPLNQTWMTCWRCPWRTSSCWQPSAWLKHSWKVCLEGFCPALLLPLAEGGFEKGKASLVTVVWVAWEHSWKGQKCAAFAGHFTAFRRIAVKMILCLGSEVLF